MTPVLNLRFPRIRGLGQFASRLRLCLNVDMVDATLAQLLGVGTPFDLAGFSFKLMIEDILRDLFKAEPDWHIALLRYFNPVGAHESGLIGEEPNGIPNNLVPYIAQVANGQREKLSVYGGDYPTLDGTGMRDYIHVVDLAIGHVKTLDKLAQGAGLVTYNLGTGNGNSVLKMVHAFEKACGKPIPYQIVDRRPGDIAKCYADPTKAREELGWSAQRDIAQMCADSWRYQITT